MNAKYAFVIIALFFGTTCCNAQDSCDSLGIILKFIDATYLQNRNEKDAARRKVLYTVYTTQSLIAAGMAERCFKLKQAAPASVQDLTNNYLAGKLYYQAGDCNKAGKKFDLCLANPHCSSEKIGNSGNYAQLINKAFKCTNSQPVASLETNSYIKIYDGKGSTFLRQLFDRMDSLIFDATPLTPSEIETIANRTIYATDTINEALAEKLSGNKSFFFSAPFLFMQGKGEFLKQRILPEKKAETDPGMSTLKRPVLENFSSFMLDQYRSLKSSYFDAFNPGGKLIPVYLNGGDYTPGGLQGYLSFCNSIHFRASRKVAYYMALDNSIVAWASSGGGTLIHEMVHALVANDNPAAPLWINEGLAGLFEESNSNGQPINNYRLIFIQQAFIKDTVCMSWTNLPAMESYASASEINYNLLSAYSRYFCKFLYDEYGAGFLPAVYRSLRNDTIKSAKEQIKLICGLTKKNPARLQQQWQQYLLKEEVPDKWKPLIASIGKDFEHHAGYVFKISTVKAAGKDISSLKKIYEKITPYNPLNPPTNTGNGPQQF